MGWYKLYSPLNVFPSFNLRWNNSAFITIPATGISSCLLNPELLHMTPAADPITYRDYGIQIIVFQGTLDTHGPSCWNVAKFATVASILSSPVSSMFFRWRRIPDLSIWNDSAIRLIESYTVSSCSRTSILVLPSSIWYRIKLLL